jgi:hypothetical protein
LKLDLFFPHTKERKKERKKERPKKLFPNKKTTTTTTTKEQECDLHQELSIWKLQQVVTPLGQKKLGKKNNNKTAICSNLVLKRHSTKSKQIWEYLAQHEHFGWFYRREIVLHTTTTQEEDTKPHTHTHTHTHTHKRGQAQDTR